MIYKRKQLPELYYMKHRSDNDKTVVDYESKILERNLSPYMFGNPTLGTFLTMLQPLVALMFDKFNIISNFKNYIVDKDTYKK